MATSQPGQAQNGSTQNGAHPDGPKRSQSTVEWAQQSLAGSFANADDAAERLKLAAQNCHLIGGASVCPMIEGHEVQITVVPINIPDCYPVKNKEGDPVKKGIPKSTLMQLAAAAGIEWTYSKRQDDGSNPHFCHWRVRGRYRQIDGTWREIEGDRDVDNRDGSDQLYGKTEKEVPQLRINTVRSAITKAKLRAIRECFGVSQGMLESELHKPFIFAKAIFTGRSNDRKVRQLFAAVIAQQQLAATAALYGAPMMPQLGTALGRAGAPLPGAPVSDSRDIDPEDDDDDEEVNQWGEVKTGAKRQASPPPAPPPPPMATPQPSRSGGGGRSGGGAMKVPFGPNRGKSITDVDEKDLKYLADFYGKAIADPAKGQYRERNVEALTAVRAEMEHRRSGPARDPRQEDLPNGEPPNDGGYQGDEDEIPY